MMGMSFEGCAHNMGTPLRDAVDRAGPEAVLAKLVVDPVHVAACLRFGVDLREDAPGFAEAILRHHATVLPPAMNDHREFVSPKWLAARHQRPDAIPDEVLLFEESGSGLSWS
jgi:hypothetical protein